MRKLWLPVVLGATLLAGCEKADYTPPSSVLKTTSCKEGCVNNAMVISADGQYLAVAGKDQVELFAIDGDGQPTTITIGADKLASSPDGAYLQVQHAVDSPSGVGVRLFRFDNGQPMYRNPGVITGLLKRERHNPFRRGGEVLEVSPYNAYTEVEALNWRYRRLTYYSVSFANGGEDPDNEPLLMAVSDNLEHTAWSRNHPDRDGVITMFGMAGTVRPAQTAWPEAPDWRTFSLDGGLYAAESKGRVAVWNTATGKITDRLEKEGVCAMSGGGAPRVNQLTVVCEGKADGAATLKVWLFPGKVLLADVTTDKGWQVRDWRVANVGTRLAVYETREGEGGRIDGRIRVFTLGKAPFVAPVVIDLAEVLKPESVAMSMSGSGRVLAVRMPNGRILIYEPDKVAAGASKGT